MRKIIFFAILLVTSSCGICYESEFRRQRAEELYYDLRTTIERGFSEKRAQEMFGCQYSIGDDIFAHTNFWEKKYILVHYGMPISYYDQDSWLIHFGEFF